MVAMILRPHSHRASAITCTFLTLREFADPLIRGTFTRHSGDCGKVLAQSPGARLAEMERGTDTACRGNKIGCEFSLQHCCCALPKWINHGDISMRGHDFRCLGATDHHQEFVGTDEGGRRPCAHRGAGEAVDHVRGQHRDNAQAKQPSRLRGHTDSPPRRVQHHHRTEPPRVSWSLHRTQGDSPVDPIGRVYRPALTNDSSVVSRHWLFGAVGPRTHRYHDLTCGNSYSQRVAAFSNRGFTQVRSIGVQVGSRSQIRNEPICLRATARLCTDRCAVARRLPRLRP